jgi:hypothetical protein
VGAGRSQEAPYALKAAIPAGNWHFVLDGIIITSVDVKFELLHRRAGADTTIVMWDQHFEPMVPQLFEATPYEYDAMGAEVPFAAGDNLVFRYSATNTIQSDAWIPNGDGEHSNGRIPYLTLPK